jgi:S1-C subfamily serine protease
MQVKLFELRAEGRAWLVCVAARRAIAIASVLLTGALVPPSLRAQDPASHFCADPRIHWRSRIWSCETALKANPTDYALRLNYAFSLFESGEPGSRTAAAEQARELARLHPDSTLRNSIALAFFLSEAGLHDEALTAAREAHRLDPGNLDVHKQVHTVLARLERYPEAFTVVTDIVRKHPHAADMWGEAALTAIALRQPEHAVALWARALKEDPAYFDRHREQQSLWSKLVAQVGMQPAATLPGESSASRAGGGSGSGFSVSKSGHLLTAAHVVAACRRIDVQFPGSGLKEANVVASDAANDLALIRIAGVTTPAHFRSRGARLGETLVAAGFPLPGIVSDQLNVTNGVVSSVSGPGGDSRLFQISAAIQPGNSGGPVLDDRGGVLGMAAAKLDAAVVFKLTGNLPENIAFGVRSSVIEGFLENHGIAVTRADPTRPESGASLGAIATRVTARVVCSVSK